MEWQGHHWNAAALLLSEPPATHGCRDPSGYKSCFCWSSHHLPTWRDACSSCVSLGQDGRSVKIPPCVFYFPPLWGTMVFFVPQEPVQTRMERQNMDVHSRQREQVNNLLKPIEKKVWGLIHLKARKFRGNPVHKFIWAGKLEHGFCVQKRKSVESERISSWRQQGSIAQSGEIRPGEARASCRVPQQVHRWTTITNGRTKIGVTGRTIRICWIYTRTSSTTRRIVYEGKSSPKYSNCTKLEKIKRAQEQRVDEVSVQKWRENGETIQQFTSQLQQMQEQKNSMNSSGEFQDIESNYSGRLSHVSSQPEMIPSSQPLLSRDKRLPLDTSNQSGVQENVFWNQFSTFDSPRGYPQRIQSDVVQRNEKQALKPQGRLVTQVKTDKIKAQFQCRHLRQGRWQRVLQYRWNCRRTTWSDSKDSKCRNYNSTGSLIHHHSWCGKQDSKHKVSSGSDFLSEAMFWIKEVETVDSLDKLKSSRSVYGKDFPNFDTLDTKIASALNKIIQNSQFKKKVSLEEQKAQKEDRFLRGRQIAFMIYDYFRVTGAHDTVLDCAYYSLLLFMMTTFRNSIRDGTKFCCRCQKFHPMISRKVCTNWGYVSLTNSKTCWNCTTWRFIRRHPFLPIKSWKPWWREV